MTQVFVCKKCDRLFESNAPRVFYCTECRAVMSNERKLKHYHKVKGLPEYKEKVRETSKRTAAKKKSRAISKGEQISEQSTVDGVLWQQKMPLPNFNVSLSFCIPFDWALSKNARVNFGNGRYWVNQHVRDAERVIEKEIKRHNIVWVQTKLFIDILVEKPNMRGDAINFVDSIIDAVKKGTGIDDRWYSLGRVDWQIRKLDPKIWVTVRQDSTTTLQACSYCGRLLPLTMFDKHKGTKTGYGRECKDCTSSRVELVVQENN